MSIPPSRIIANESGPTAEHLVDKGTHVRYHEHMLARGVVEVVQEVLGTDPATCDADALTTIAADVHRLRCWLDSVDVAVVARSAELALAGGRRSCREADVVHQRAAVCAAMPEVHAALATGTLSAGHADAIARAANRLDDQERIELAARSPELVEQAASMSVDAFGRKVRDIARRISRDDGLHHHERLRSQRAVRRWMDREGMCHTQIDLDPETDARLSAAFDAAVAAERSKPDDGRTFDQLRADAFMAMATATVTPGARRPAELIVLCDLATLRDGLHDNSVCETYDGQPLPPATVRRLACEADIIPVVLGGDGRVVDVGRARRLATADQRRALRRDASNVCCGGLPGALRRLRHPPPPGMAPWRRDRVGEPGPAVQQAPSPRPRGPVATTGPCSRRLTGGLPAGRRNSQTRHPTSPPRPQELLSHRAGAPMRRAALPGPAGGGRRDGDDHDAAW